MAHLHNFPRQKYRPSMLKQFGEKVKDVAAFATAAKGIFDVGRSIYQGIQTIGPAMAIGATLL